MPKKTEQVSVLARQHGIVFRKYKLQQLNTNAGGNPATLLRERCVIN
jgi:hypothetical protein